MFDASLIEGVGLEPKADPRPVVKQGMLAPPATWPVADTGSSRSYAAWPWSVRRLTPLECERLQGFPDGYTDIAIPGRNWSPDGPRYKALGNSMAVNGMGWIGERIALVEEIIGASD